MVKFGGGGYFRVVAGDSAARGVSEGWRREVLRGE